MNTNKVYEKRLEVVKAESDIMAEKAKPVVMKVKPVAEVAKVAGNRVMEVVTADQTKALAKDVAMFVVMQVVTTGCESVAILFGASEKLLAKTAVYAASKIPSTIANLELNA